MRRALLSAALIAAATVGLTPHAARAADNVTPPTLTLQTDTLNGFSWIETLVDIPEASGTWTLDTRLAVSPDSLAGATPREDTVNGAEGVGVSIAESFATEGWTSHSVLTGGRRYWVEVTARPADDPAAPPVDLVESIVTALTPATTSIRAATPIDDVPAGVRVNILGRVDRTGPCPEQWEPCDVRLVADLQARPTGTTTWTTIATARTAPGLLLSAYARVDRSTDYRWFYGTAGPIDQVASAVLHIDAHANGVLALPRSATAGHPIRGSARISPTNLGGPVTLQVFDGHWRTVTTATVNSKGVAHFLFTPKKPGTWKYRVVIASRPDLIGGTTMSAKVKVHRH